MKGILAIAVAAGLTGTAGAQIVINEVLGSTGGPDGEFIEIANLGGAAVDISGYTIELWDSDTGAFGGSDAGSPYVVDAGTVLNAGEVWVLGNATAQTFYLSGSNNGNPSPTSFAGQNFRIDQVIQANAIENSSYTMILTDAASTAIDAWFFDDGDGDVANRAGGAVGVAISENPTPEFGSVQSGWALGMSGSFGLNFSSPNFNNVFPATGDLNDGTLEGGTPGILQQTIPAPGAFALLGLGGLVAARRRR